MFSNSLVLCFFPQGHESSLTSAGIRRVTCIVTQLGKEDYPLYFTFRSRLGWVLFASFDCRLNDLFVELGDLLGVAFLARQS